MPKAEVFMACLKKSMEACVAGQSKSHHRWPLQGRDLAFSWETDRGKGWFGGRCDLQQVTLFSVPKSGSLGFHRHTPTVPEQQIPYAPSWRSDCLGPTPRDHDSVGLGPQLHWKFRYADKLGSHFPRSILGFSWFTPLFMIWNLYGGKGCKYNLEYKQVWKGFCYCYLCKQLQHDLITPLFHHCFLSFSEHEEEIK